MRSIDSASLYGENLARETRATERVTRVPALNESIVEGKGLYNRGILLRSCLLYTSDAADE